MLTFPDIDPVAIRLGPITIYWYAITYLVGFALGYVLMRRRLHHEPFRSIAKPEKYSPAFIEDLLTVAILGVLLGGRLGYCFFYKPSYYFTHPVDIIKVWDGGMSFHGGALGVILGMLWLAWRRGRPFLQISDLIVPAVPLGLMCGRIGNFINGELWGRPAPDWLPWAMIFPTGGDVARHPSQIYQALGEGLTLFLLIWFYARRHRFRGQVSGFFLAGYGAFRFAAEFFREPDDFLGLLGLGLSMGQWLSLPMIIAGIALWWWASVRRIDDAEPEGAAADDPSPVENPAENPDDNSGDATATEEVDPEDAAECGGDKEARSDS